MKHIIVCGALMASMTTPTFAVTTVGDDNAPAELAVPFPQTNPEQVVERARQIAGAIADSDYPATAIMTGGTGTSVARIVINETGRVSGCQAAGSGSAILDETTCRLIVERFRFVPARDVKGAAIAEARTQRVAWRIPTGIRLGQSPQPMRLTISFSVGIDGSVSDCKIVHIVPKSGPQLPCPTYVPPYRDAMGNPVKKHVEFVTEVNVTDSAP